MGTALPAFPGLFFKYYNGEFNLSCGRLYKRVKLLLLLTDELLDTFQQVCSHYSEPTIIAVSNYHII